MRGAFVLTYSVCAGGVIDQLIIATGADSRWLGVPNEHVLRGYGVSSCATCDGYLYRGRKIVVIGAQGVNEALIQSPCIELHVAAASCSTPCKFSSVAVRGTLLIRVCRCRRW